MKNLLVACAISVSASVWFAIFFPLFAYSPAPSKHETRLHALRQKRLQALEKEIGGEAVQAESGRNFDLAEKKYKQLTKAAPRNVLLNILIGKFYLRRGRASDAFIALSPLFNQREVVLSDLALQMAYGNICVKLGHPKEARIAFLGVIKNFGDYWGGGLSPINNNKTSDAEVEGLARACLAMQGDPSLETGWRSWKNAISEGKSACRLAPSWALTHFGLGEALYRGHMYAESKKEFDAALALVTSDQRPEVQRMIDGHGMFRIDHVSMVVVRHGQLTFSTKKIPLPNRFVDDEFGVHEKALNGG